MANSTDQLFIQISLFSLGFLGQNWANALLPIRRICQRGDVQKINFKMQFRRTSHLASLKQKIYFISDRCKFFGVASRPLTVLYFLTHTLTLVATFDNIEALMPSSSYFFTVLQQINDVFFYNSDSYKFIDQQYNISIIISLFLFTLLSLIAYLGYSIQTSNPTPLDRKKLTFIKAAGFLLICCNVPIGAFCSYQFLQMVQNGHYIFAIPIMNVILLLTFVYLIQEYSCEINFLKLYSLSRLYSKNQSRNTIVKLVVRIIITSLGTLFLGSLVLVLLTLLLFDLLQLKIAIFNQKYLDPFTQSAYQIKIIAMVILELLAILCLATQSNLILNNFMLTAFSTTLISVQTLTNYKVYQKKQFILEDLAAVQSQDDAVIYMYEYMSILGEGPKQEIIILSLITIHRRCCTAEDCFCHTYNSAQSQALAKDEQFLIRFVLYKLEKVRQKYPSSFMILGIFLTFKLTYMKAFSKIYQHMRKYVKFIGGYASCTHEEYLIFQLQRKVDIQSKKIVQGSNLQIGKVFREESLREELVGLIQKINSRNLQKYKKISLQFCNLNKVERLCDEITAYIRTIEELWVRFKAKDSYNMRIYEVFLIYFDFIVHTKRQIGEVKNTIGKKLQLLRYLKGISLENLEKYLYSKRACVLEANLNGEKLEAITNTSQYCMNVFQHSRSFILGKDIHDIMPEFLSSGHQKCVHDWIEKETLTSKLNGIKNTFYVDKNYGCFSGGVYLKVASLGMKIKVYALVVKDNVTDYLVLNHRFEIEGFGKRLENERIIGVGHIKRDFRDLCGVNLEEEIKGRMSLKRRLMIRKESLQGGPRDAPQGSHSVCSSEQSLAVQTPQTCVYECDVLIERQFMGKQHYYSIRFLEIRKLVVSSLLSPHVEHQPVKISSNMKFKFRPSPKTKRLVIDKEQFKEVSMFEDHESLDIVRQDGQDDLSDRFNAHKLSSIADSLVGESNMALRKLVEKLKERVIRPSKVRGPLVLVTVFLILLALLVGLCIFSQQSVYKAGLQSFNNIIFGDCAVSNNNQLFQMVYNIILTTNNYCYSSDSALQSRCQYLIRSSQTIIQVLYSLLVSDIEVYLQNVTMLSGMKFYQSYEIEVGININGDYSLVSTREFMEYYYYSLRQIGLATKPGSTSRSQQITRNFDFLFRNWNTMKYVNHNALNFYESGGKNQLLLLSNYTYLFSVIFFILSMGMVLLIRWYYGYVYNKREKIVKIHRYISHSLCQTLRHHVAWVDQCLQNCYEELFMRYNMDAKQIKNNGHFKYQKNCKSDFYLLSVFVMLGLFNVSCLVIMVQLFTPAQNMVELIDDLMDSQNYAYENYFQLKTYYLQYNFSQTPQQISQEIALHLNQTQVQFAKYAQQSLDMYSQSDQNFLSDFNSLIVDDVCDLTAAQMQEWQVVKCKEGMHYQILTKGLVAGMVSWQRQTFQALLQLRDSQISDKEAYFKQAIFQDLDDYIFYMFRLYQATEARMIQGLNQSIESKINSCIAFLALQATILLGLIIFWVLRWGSEQLVLSNLYGQVLQMPQILFKQNKVVFKIVQDNLEMKV